ncbi:MAG: huP [Cyanobacteria bacterium RYN_339]|nr:huP [Cyanobacteria bacterium RYN_339]
MNKEELVKIVSEKARITQKDAHELIGTTLDCITHALSKGDKVTLVGFGTFQVRERAAREGRNPRTGAVLHIAAKKTPAFAPGKLLKERVIAGGRKLVGSRR